MCQSRFKDLQEVDDAELRGSQYPIMCQFYGGGRRMVMYLQLLHSSEDHENSVWNHVSVIIC